MSAFRCDRPSQSLHVGWIRIRHKTWKTLKWFRFSARYEQSVPVRQTARQPVAITVLALRWKWTGTQSEIAFSQDGVEHVSDFTTRWRMKKRSAAEYHHRRDSESGCSMKCNRAIVVVQYTENGDDG